jgi:hypothetical protein
MGDGPTNACWLKWPAGTLMSGHPVVGVHGNDESIASLDRCRE